MTAGVSHAFVFEVWKVRSGRISSALIFGFAALSALAYSDSYFSSLGNPALEAFTLPGAWRAIITRMGGIGRGVSLGLAITWACQDFDLGVLRQQVASGVSRSSIVTAKILLVPVVGVVVLLAQILPGAGFAMTATLQAGAPIRIPWADVVAMGLYLMELTGFATLGFLAGIFMRRSAGGLVLGFGYAYLGEPILSLLLQRGGWSGVADMLPARVLGGLVRGFYQEGSFSQDAGGAALRASASEPLVGLLVLVTGLGVGAWFLHGADY
ncbi:MAG: hypothetical protein OEZ65_09645 [Gemmatimonadota bacterium]|nr:hypothetical protein [Gemmatimonadota bacterium]